MSKKKLGLIGHLKYNSSEKLSTWRKVSMSSWQPTGDSSTYVLEDIIVDDLLMYCKQNNLSLNAVVMQAVAQALNENPRVNSIIRFGKIFQRQNNNVFFHVINTSKKDDLSGFTIENAHKKTFADIDTEIVLKRKLILDNKDHLGASKKMFTYFPVFVVKILMNTLSFILYKLNIAIPSIPKDPFGAVMITSVGSLGIQAALCPIAPYTNNSMVISVGKIKSQPVAIQETLAIRKIITFGFTFDHRLIDGFQFQQFYKSLLQYLTPNNSTNSYNLTHEK
jgi:2-oxoacid dehydrogenases acyltransferase (catalytic domain)